MDRRRYLAALAATGVAGCLRLEATATTDPASDTSSQASNVTSATQEPTETTPATTEETATATETTEPPEPSDVASIERTWRSESLGGNNRAPHIAVQGDTLYVANDTVTSIRPSTGAESPGVPLGGPARTVSATEDALYVGTRGDQPQVHRIDPSGSAVDWTVDVPGGVTMVEDIIVRSGEVFVGSTEVTSSNAAALHVLDEDSGELRFAYSWDPSTTIDSLAYHQDVVYVGLANATGAYDADDRRVFNPREEWGFRVDKPVVVHDDVLYAAGQNLTAMDLSSKSFLFRYPFGNPQYLEPAVVGGRVVAGGEDGVYCVDARSGDLHWHASELGSVAAGPVCWNDVAFVVTDAGRLIALELLEGAIVGETAVAESGPVDLVRVDGQLVVAAMHSVSSWTIGWA